MASVSNSKRHGIKRKQTREKVCGLCFNANSCNMQNQNKYFGNSQSFPPLFQLNFATVYVLQYSFWNHKAKSYGIKTTSFAHKTTSYAHKRLNGKHGAGVPESEFRSRSLGVGAPECDVKKWKTRSIKYGKHGV